MELKELFGTRFTVDNGAVPPLISNVNDVIVALSLEVGSISIARSLIMDYTKLQWDIRRATLEKCTSCGEYHETPEDQTNCIVSGTFPKRLKNVAYKVRGLKLSDDAIARIGEIAKRGISDRRLLYMDVTDDLNWRSGQFGDSGSCYWGGREYARKMIVRGGGGAIRQWTDETYQRGLSRCWILPVPKTDGLVIFNAYGHINLSQFADTLAKAWDLETNRMDSTTNLGTSGGILYFNSPGYYLHPRGTTRITRYDFRIPEEDSTECGKCGQLTRTRDLRMHDGVGYCPTCYRSMIVQCKRCKTYILKEKAIVSADTDRVYCPTCAEHYCLHPCQQCGSMRGETRHGEPNMIHIDGYWYCLDHAPREVEHDSQAG